MFGVAAESGKYNKAEEGNGRSGATLWGWQERVRKMQNFDFFLTFKISSLLHDSDYADQNDSSDAPDPRIVTDQEERLRLRTLVQDELRKRRGSSTGTPSNVNSHAVPQWSDKKARFGNPSLEMFFFNFHNFFSGFSTASLNNWEEY